MEIGDAMVRIADEAQRQGFVVRPTASGVWIFRKGRDMVAVVEPRDAIELLDVLSVLILAGLDWTLHEG